MQTTTLYLPPKISAAQLRADLEEIIRQYDGRTVTERAYPLAQGVGLIQVYEIPSKGTVIAFSNDLNVFCGDAPHVPGGALYCTGWVMFSGFNENTYLFQMLKDNIEYLNNKYNK